VFQGSEIYGGLAGTWDYGPLGVALKNNIKQLWWKMFVDSRDDMYGLDAAILMHPKVWESSGHVSGFSDPLVECKKCKKRFRADHLDGSGTCPECGGKGLRRWVRGHMVFTAPCDMCHGEGRLSVERCRTCQGTGIQPRGEVVTIAVPPGVEDGARLVVPGRGHLSGQGAALGDLYVMVRVGTHRVFRRVGRNLHIDLPVAVHEAALGARVDVPTLGEPVRVKIPPGTSSGQSLRLSGRGVPAASPAEPAGDLLIDVQIVVPPLRDERSRELMREFSRLNVTDVRRHLFEET